MLFQEISFSNLFPDNVSYCLPNLWYHYISALLGTIWTIIVFYMTFQSNSAGSWKSNSGSFFGQFSEFTRSPNFVPFQNVRVKLDQCNNCLITHYESSLLGTYLGTQTYIFLLIYIYVQVHTYLPTQSEPYRFPQPVL